MPPSAGRDVRSHRRPPGPARARAVSLVAVGALAGGVAIASTSAPWPREATDRQPQGPDRASGASGTDHRVAPVPPVPAQEPVAAETDPDPAPPVPAPQVWRADGPGAFHRTPWTTVGTAVPQVDGDEVSFRLTGRGQRSELEPAIPVVHEGDQHDLTFAVRLDGEHTGDHVIARWENDSPGQAPLALRVRNGELVLRGGEGHPSGPRTFTRALGHAPLGEWTRLRVLVRFSADPEKGGVSVWRDGRPVVDDERPRGGTLYPGQQSYLKVGLHRDRTVASPSTARFGALRVDHGRADRERDDSRTDVRRSTDDRAGSSGDRSARDGSERRRDEASERSGRQRADRGGTGTDERRSTDASEDTGSDRDAPSTGSDTEDR
ncbi:heparin lyase I family protein [Actinomycetospora flava]|uniref:Heparin lyase I family protein n=1 Tax=Actinomycetospora flava TaxID=3129232 RepID=A0ABU8M9J8_9PSEU